jgi:hypothetical protein
MSSAFKPKFKNKNYFAIVVSPATVTLIVCDAIFALAFFRKTISLKIILSLKKNRETEFTL